MKAIALQKNIHLSARKAGLVCDLIRNKPIKHAIVILQNTPKKAAQLTLKILNSAIANATNNHGMKADALYVYNAIANQGTTIKRTMERAKGSADLLKKRHCHIYVTLSDDKNEKEKDLLAIKAKKAKKGDKK
jgi:ribosomal protein L22